MTAARLRALHRPGEPVILPNVWDAASARGLAALSGGGSNDRLAETVRRARAYLEAGADCVYPIFATGPDHIRACEG